MSDKFLMFRSVSGPETRPAFKIVAVSIEDISTFYEGPTYINESETIKTTSICMDNSVVYNVMSVFDPSVKDCEIFPGIFALYKILNYNSSVKNVYNDILSQQQENLTKQIAAKQLDSSRQDADNSEEPQEVSKPKRRKKSQNEQ